MDYFQARGGTTWITMTVRSLARELVDCYDFDRIGCPLLIVHGAKDRIVPVITSEELHRNVAGSKLVIRENWGHCPQLDDPAGLVDLILRFTASAQSARRSRPAAEA